MTWVIVFREKYETKREKCQAKCSAKRKRGGMEGGGTFFILFLLIYIILIKSFKENPIILFAFSQAPQFPNERGEGGVLVLLVVVSSLAFFLILFSSLSLSLPLGVEDKVCVIMQSKSPTTISSLLWIPVASNYLQPKVLHRILIS